MSRAGLRKIIATGASIGVLAGAAGCTNHPEEVRLGQESYTYAVSPEGQTELDARLKPIALRALNEVVKSKLKGDIGRTCGQVTNEHAPVMIGDASTATKETLFACTVAADGDTILASRGTKLGAFVFNVSTSTMTTIERTDGQKDYLYHSETLTLENDSVNPQKARHDGYDPKKLAAILNDQNTHVTLLEAAIGPIPYYASERSTVRTDINLRTQTMQVDLTHTTPRVTDNPNESEGLAFLARKNPDTGRFLIAQAQNIIGEMPGIIR